MNIAYHEIIIKYLKVSNIILRYWDRGLIEIMTPYGLVNLINYISFRLELLNTGYYLHYFFFILLSLFFILIV